MPNESSDRDDKDRQIERMQEQQNFEQGTAWLADNLPRFWGRMFENLVDNGFRREEALQLLQTYIQSTNKPPEV